MKNCISVLPTASAAELGALPGPATDTTDSATSPPVATISGIIINIILKFSCPKPLLELLSLLLPSPRWDGFSQAGPWPLCCPQAGMVPHTKIHRFISPWTVNEHQM